jgi:hypothetical protein
MEIVITSSGETTVFEITDINAQPVLTVGCDISQ